MSLVVTPAGRSKPAASAGTEVPAPHRNVAGGLPGVGVQPVQRLARTMRDEHTLVFATLPIGNANAGGIEIPEVQSRAPLRRDARRQRDLDARAFDSGGRVEAPAALHVSRVRED